MERLSPDRNAVMTLRTALKKGWEGEVQGAQDNIEMCF